MERQQMKNKEKTIIAAYHRPVKVRLVDSADAILLLINRIVGAKFTTLKKPLQLLKELPALKIYKKGFYTNAKVNLKVNSKFEVASTEEILQRQSEFMKGLIEENKQSIKKIALEKLNEKYRKAEERTKSKKKRVEDEIQNLAEYIKSNKIILWAMLIPVFLIILFIIIFFFDN